MTSTAISTYQNTPSPSRLTMANARRIPERAPMRLTLRHQPASLASMRLRGGRACMCLAPCEAGEDVVERGCHVVRAQPRHCVRSEEHTSELQSLMRISYAVFCLKKKNNNSNNK